MVLQGIKRIDPLTTRNDTLSETTFSQRKSPCFSSNILLSHQYPVKTVSGSCFQRFLAAWLYENQLLQIDHPFTRYLGDAGLDPRHICLTFPDYDSIQRAKYQTENHHVPSYLDRKEQRRVENEKKQEYRMAASAFTSVTNDFPNFGHRLRTLIIHNFKGGRIPLGREKVRIFFAKCNCLPSSKISPDCFQHVGPRQRRADISQLATSVISYRSSGRLTCGHTKDTCADKWELVCERSTGGPDVKGLLRDRLQDSLQEVTIESPNFGLEDIQIIEWEDAEPCVCCGKK
ncbi:uncharacterized protein L201_004350 [Kwoniella dendrophila CBS 6074]|uniref:Uncharacterized protein n=1 Tax=Kwoniella dendrophila CBS 6074 TaxID=1295534 RepID=A0AAX4JVH7_9TREE